MSVDDRAALAGIDCFASQQGWDAHWRAHLQASQERDALQRRILSDPPVDGIDGICALCASRQRFALPSAHAAIPASLREELRCSGCGLNARVRAAFEMLARVCPQPGARIFLTEQASRAFVWLRRRHPRCIGSEFMRSWMQRVRFTVWLWLRRTFVLPRFEDVTRLRLRDASFDAVLSFDVLEHVPDYRSAIAEFARITCPGGWLIMTVPIDLSASTSIQRARVRGDGTIEHLLEPEYHGDPLGAGVLCYHGFGWDLLDALRDAGYRKPLIALPWNPPAALYSGLQTVLAQR